MVLTRSGRFLSIVLLGTTAVPAFAQTPVAPTREEVERGRIDPADTQRRGRLSVEGGVERAPCPLADPRYADIRVTISDVQFNGLAGLPPEALRPSWTRFAGQSVPIATVCDIRDEAATILRRAGYLAAVQVPPQRIEDNGVVRFDVLMARLVGVQVRGDAGRSERIIAGYLEKIRDQQVFNVNDAERYLLLARDLPGYDVRLTLRPAGTVPGEVIGEVSVLSTPIEVDLNLQNYGSRDTGRFGGLVRAQFNGLTGLGDQTTLSYFATADFEEQHVLNAGHAFRIGSEGLTIGGDFTYAWTKPDIGPGGVFRSETLIASARATYPVLRSQSSNVFATLGFDFIDQEVRFGGTPISEDNLRVLFARVDYDAADPDSIAGANSFSASEPRWRFGASVEARHGIDVFGASGSCGGPPLFANCQPPRVGLSKSEADPTAFIVRGQAYGEFRPVPNITFSIAPRAQYSSKPLLSYEEFSAGNYTVGRGYDPGTITGDSGIGVSAEIRFGSIVPRSINGVSFQPFFFFDAARVYNEDRLFPPYPPGSSDLYSYGIGARGAWGNRARLDLTLAVPERRAGLLAFEPGARLLASLTVKLVPWNR